MELNFMQIPRVRHFSRGQAPIDPEQISSLSIAEILDIANRTGFSLGKQTILQIDLTTLAITHDLDDKFFI